MYVVTYASNRGVVGGVSSHFGKGGGAVYIVEQLVVVGPTEETAVHVFAPSLWRSAEAIVSSTQ